MHLVWRAQGGVRALPMLDAPLGSERFS